MRVVYNDHTEEIIKRIEDQINRITKSYKEELREVLKPLHEKLVEIHLTSIPVRYEFDVDEINEKFSKGEL